MQSRSPSTRGPGPAACSVCTPALRDGTGARRRRKSALAVGSTVYARALRQTTVSEGITLAVPAAACAIAWTRSTPAGRWFLDNLLDLSVIVVDPLDAQAARAVGVVLARRPAGVPPGLDLGQAVVSARARGWPALATAPGLLLALAPDLTVESMPP
jgi:hypothetical protein